MSWRAAPSPRADSGRSLRPMVNERAKSPRARLFVALDLPDEIRSRLARWQADSLTEEKALRSVPPEALHLTLAFLGHLPTGEIDGIAAIVTASKAAAPEIRLEPDPIPIPPGRPRLFAIEVKSRETLAIQALLSKQLQAARVYEPEERPFWPHLTVARVRRETGGRRRPARVQHPPGRLPQALEQPFDGVRLSLYRSNLRPEGAEYVSLVNVELPPRGGLRGE